MLHEPSAHALTYEALDDVLNGSAATALGPQCSASWINCARVRDT
jgi:hypothetical protein